VARDSLFGERIVWSGRAGRVSLPFTSKVMASVSAVVALVTLGYAVVIARSLTSADVRGMIAFACWCSAVALGAWRLPLWWLASAEYIVTDKHVIWRRGRVRRSIEIGSISYARIRWADAKHGDLVLVRAVPTGALRRTLSLTLGDVDAPDRLWAIVRGVEPSAPLGDGDRPLGQRLDGDERVLWSGVPLATPWNARRAAMASAAIMVLATFVYSLVVGVPGIRRVVRVHALPPGMLALFVASAALGSLLLLAVGLGIAYAAALRPVRLARQTRYFVTDARVLIRRGVEELHLDRSRIAYVIDALAGTAMSAERVRALHDVFLVLDGPYARAMAASGAFDGEGDALRGDGALRPVFNAIQDAETVTALLRPGPPMKKAA
jgi:hypothetical protein